MQPECIEIAWWFAGIEAGCIGGHKLGAFLGGAQSRLLRGVAADVHVCAYIWASIHTFSRRNDLAVANHS